jgi:biotin-dependent carboxylase-like uncharacterized protein
MDRFSFLLGNLLLGNHPNSAAIETVHSGFRFQILANTVAAITGADLGPTIDNKPIPMWTLIELEAGCEMHFSHRYKGLRAYLHIRGGVDGPVYFGSRSTYRRGGMGRPLASGDEITAIPAKARGGLSHRSLPADVHHFPDSNEPIGILEGPQMNAFTRRGVGTFLNALYTVSPRCDRQALCTQGPKVEHAGDPGIITDPTPPGAIQVPGDGKPIVLLRDGQVTGGYAKIGTAAYIELDRLAQFMPGDKIRFKFISRNEAIGRWRSRRQVLNECSDQFGLDAYGHYYLASPAFLQPSLKLQIS